MTDPTTTSAQRDRWTTALDGTRLRQLRHQHGVSQEQLADRAAISLTTIARLASPGPPAAAEPCPDSPPRSASHPPPSPSNHAQPNPV